MIIRNHYSHVRIVPLVFARLAVCLIHNVRVIRTQNRSKCLGRLNDSLDMLGARLALHSVKCCSKIGASPNPSLVLRGEELGEVDSLCYLNGCTSLDVRLSREVFSGTRQARSTFASFRCLCRRRDIRFSIGGAVHASSGTNPAIYRRSMIVNAEV